jgi:hypothetical protein
MKAIRILSIIGLAAYLVLEGIFWLFDVQSPIFEAFIGAIGLATGVLIFISLTHWFDNTKDFPTHHRDNTYKDRP